MRIKFKMQKSSDFIRGCIEKFKEKCAISVIPIAFAKIIRICSPITEHFFYGTIKKIMWHSWQLSQKMVKSPNFCKKKTDNFKRKNCIPSTYLTKNTSYINRLLSKFCQSTVKNKYLVLKSTTKEAGILSTNNTCYTVS